MTTYDRRKALRLALGAMTLPLLTKPVLAASHGGAKTVEISGFKFSPANLSVKAGDTVQFVNMDGAPHTATAKDGSFDTGRLGKGQSKAVTFSKKGTFDYFCAVHPNMKGKITVA